MDAPTLGRLNGNIPKKVGHDHAKTVPTFVPPPNSTECDGVLRYRSKALLDKASVALRHNSYRSVQIIDFSCDQYLQAGGRRFESCTAHHISSTDPILARISNSEIIQIGQYCCGAAQARYVACRTSLVEKISHISSSTSKLLQPFVFAISSEN
jgi:hypothetical protein